MRSFVVALFVSSVLVGCPSKEGGQKDAQAPGPNAPVTGPLAGLETSPFLNEVWIAEDGQRAPFLFYSRENVRVSASCRQPSGQLGCDALRFLRGGTPVELPRASLDGRMSAGVKACQKLSNAIIVVHNANGNEDSFCRFPDGSMLSNGALEQYGLRVTQ